MTIKQNLLSSTKYSLKSPYTMTPVGICVHNTANDATAKGEISYMITNTSSTSFHVAVDDIEAWQGIPFTRNSHHSGTTDGNRNYISIEICYSKSGGDKFLKAEDNAAILIAQILTDKGWGIDRVKKHQDFSGKYCPHRTLDMGWSRFLVMVQNKMKGNMANYYPTTQPYVDLNNIDSVKAAIDAWVDVVNQKYVQIPKDEQFRLFKGQTRVGIYSRNIAEALENAERGRAEDLRRVREALKLSETASVDEITLRINELTQQPIPENPPISNPDSGVPTVDSNFEITGYIVTRK